MNKSGSFADRVCEVVKSIPKGKVMTYGQIAALCGDARSARVVGGIAHFGDSNLPWHRVVNKSGGLASGYPGGRSVQQKLLEAEGCSFIADESGCSVDLTKDLFRLLV